MKYLFLSLLAFFTGFTSLADCSSSGFYFWPGHHSTLSENPLIIIEGYASSQKIISKLSNSNPVYLQNENHKVQLELEELQVGGLELTQALFRTSESLHDGKEYELVIENYAGELGKLMRYDNKNHKYVKVKWTVKKNVDAKSPEFTKNPELTESTIQHLGCGPAKKMLFSYETNEQSNVIIKITLTNTGNNSSQTYHMWTNKSAVSIGHNMCSGQFGLTENANYSITWQMIDANWNRGKAVTTLAKYKPEDTWSN